MKHRGVAGERGGGAGLGRDEAVLPIVQVFSDPRRRPTTGELCGLRDVPVADAAVLTGAESSRESVALPAEPSLVELKIRHRG